MEGLAESACGEGLDSVARRSGLEELPLLQAEVEELFAYHHGPDFRRDWQEFEQDIRNYRRAICCAPSERPRLDEELASLMWRCRQFKERVSEGELNRAAVVPRSR